MQNLFSYFKISNARIISSIVISTIFITTIMWLNSLFYIIIAVLAVLMLKEWVSMCYNKPLSLIIGFITIPISVTSLLLLHKYSLSKFTLVSYFCMIWSTDTFAMLGGRYFRGPKLAPKISPNKSWSGLICGMLASALVTLIMYGTTSKLVFASKVTSCTTAFVLGLLIAAVAQLSDLFVSYFKRQNNIKDSGNIIPGHGGVLDRFDSIIFTTPLFLMLLFYL